MSVVAQCFLPAQPAVGFTKYRPLGGDGFRSPKTLARVNQIATGDASGNGMFNFTYVDPNFSAVLSWCSASVTGTQRVIRLALQVEDALPTGQLYSLLADNLDGYAGSLQAFASQVTWVPPPVVLYRADDQTVNPFLGAQVTNVTGNVLQVASEWYLFDKRAPETGYAADMLAFSGRSGARFFHTTV